MRGTAMHRLERASADVHRYVSQRVSNRADAADISQETLLVACAKLHTFRGENLHAWLFAIARNLIVDYYRARNQVQLIAVEPAIDDEPQCALQVPPDPIVTKCDFRRRLDDWLERCNERLHVPQQIAVLLADVYEYRDKDSAAMLRMSVPSFKLLLHRSRARLNESSAAPEISDHLGVTCRLAPTQLRALQQKLIEGLRVAAFYVWTLISDWCDLELIELLFDL
jgi:RNA polymerase sigma-70 factor, ECF subfamily